ncbi:MAG: hypothetical protein QOH88_2192 [Verrucomicrobiota bacterium]|jgi:hypothetical protein
MNHDEMAKPKTRLRQRGGSWRRAGCHGLCLFALAMVAQGEPLANVGLTLSLSASEKKSFNSAASVEGSDMFPTIEYVEKTESGTLQLLPRLLVKRGVESEQHTFDYLALLQKGGPIDALWQTGAPEFTFMFPSVDVRVVNNSQRKLLFTEVLLNVASSEPDLTPLPFVAETVDYFTFKVLNEGWTAMESCSVKFSISPSEWKRDPVPQFEKTLGKLDRSAAVNVSAELVKAGLSPRWIERVKELRKKNEDGEPDEALMKPFSSNAYLAGVLSYSWRDQSGSLKASSVRFRVTVPLWVGPQGGPSAISGRYEAMLRADGRDYTVRIPVSHQVNPATTTRLLVRLGVPKTSRHRFNLQLRTTRGETVESGPVALDGLLPPAAAEQLKREAAAQKNPPPP